MHDSHDYAFHSRNYAFSDPRNPPNTNGFYDARDHHNADGFHDPRNQHRTDGFNAQPATVEALVQEEARCGLLSLGNPMYDQAAECPPPPHAIQRPVWGGAQNQWQAPPEQVHEYHNAHFQPQSQMPTRLPTPSPPPYLQPLQPPQFQAPPPLQFHPQPPPHLPHTPPHFPPFPPPLEPAPLAPAHAHEQHPPMPQQHQSYEAHAPAPLQTQKQHMSDEEIEVALRRITKVAARPFSSEQVAAILDHGFEGGLAPRDRAWFSLGVKTGYRVSEILSVRVCDLAHYTGPNPQDLVIADHLTVAKQYMKGKKASRTVQLHPLAKQYIADWIMYTRSCPTYLVGGHLVNGKGGQHREPTRHIRPLEMGDYLFRSEAECKKQTFYINPELNGAAKIRKLGAELKQRRQQVFGDANDAGNAVQEQKSEPSFEALLRPEERRVLADQQLEQNQKAANTALKKRKQAIRTLVTAKANRRKLVDTATVQRPNVLTSSANGNDNDNAQSNGGNSEIREQSSPPASAPAAAPRVEFTANYIRGKHLSDTVIRTLLKRACTRIGLGHCLRDYSSHSMRKTFADRIFRATGYDLEATRKALGQTQVTSTQRYVQFSGRENVNPALLPGL